ncbi:MAG: SIR2 family protein [Xanthomonadales bacterium]|nr:SIR2 family protein [Xanthomonadales bacterium]
MKNLSDSIGFSTHDFKGLIPQSLVRALSTGRCAIFAGSGLSSQAQTPDGKPLPNWQRLLVEMIDWCVDEGITLQAEPDELRSAVNRRRFLSVAEELQQSLGQRQASCLSKILRTADARPGMAHEILTKLPVSCVITSNYDALIEGAFAAQSGGILPPVYSQAGLDQALSCLREGRFFVFKAHGDLNQSSSIVLGSRDYTRLLYLSPAYRSFLEAIFSSHTVLFVGFGGDDPDLDAVIDKLSALYERGLGRHFILLPSDQFSAFERRRLLQDRQLDCITYARDGSHSQVVEFLKGLYLRSRDQGGESVLAENEEVKESTQPKICIIGGSRDTSFIEEIQKLSEEAGYGGAKRRLEVVGDHNAADRISLEIDEADCLVPVFSGEDYMKPLISFAIDRAFAADKDILPITVGDARMPPEARPFSSVHVDKLPASPQVRASILSALRRMHKNR